MAGVPDWAESATCVVCAGTQSTRIPDYCRRCGAPLVLPERPMAVDAKTGRLPGVWAYGERLPAPPEYSWLSLGEGGTPLVAAAAAQDWTGVQNLRLKLEHLNPSGSFKDRATAVGIAHALAGGADTVICASSGNAAGSTAAYAARAGLRAVVVLPEAVPMGKLRMALAHGATVLRVCGDYSHSFAVGQGLSHRFGWINLTTTFVNPIAVSGLKTVGYELAGQLDQVPDWVLVPVGAGPLLHGVMTAFREMREIGTVERIPRMAAVQVKGCAPIVEAFESGASEVRAWGRTHTTVSAISDPLRGYPADGSYTLRLVRESGGYAVAVSDEDTAAAADLLASGEGLLLEPGASVGLAAARELRTRNIIGGSELVVCLLTGHGAKTLTGTETTDAPIVEDVEEAAAFLARRPER